MKTGDEISERIKLRLTMASIQIPKDDLPALLELAGLDDATFDSLLKIIEQTKPKLTIPQFATEIIKSVKLEPRTLFPMLQAIFGAYHFKASSGMSASDAAKGIAEAAPAQASDKFPEDTAKKLQARLGRLLSLDSIGVTEKAVDVMTENANTFCSARILSDIRPVFTDSPRKAVGAAIIHNLQIGYHESGHKKAHKEFYVALDLDDIAKLKAVIARAEEKTAALKEMIESAKLNHLEP